jgi:hypothetical protein
MNTGDVSSAPDAHTMSQPAGRTIAARPKRRDRPGRLERLADARAPLWAVGLIVMAGLAGMIGFGAVVRNPGDYGQIGVLATGVASIPETLQRLDDDFGTYHPSIAGGYMPLPGGLWRNPAQPLVDRGALLVTVFDTARKRYVVKLLRLSDGHVLRDYAPDMAAIDARSTFHSALVDLSRDKTNRLYMPMHPMLMPDGGLILHDTSPLVRVNACGRAEWMIDGIFHHAIERAPDGTLWANSREPVSQQQGVGPGFIDEGMTHLTADGHVLARTSVIGMLDRAGLGYLWRSRPYLDDPIHVNDIEPVPGDGPYWHKGDVFVSLRNLSLVLLYRPSEDRVVWSRATPWKFQHDVSVLDDHRISVFDNHLRQDWGQGEHLGNDGTNHLVVYDFATQTTSEPLARTFHDLGITTKAQGRATPLANGDTMIEETEQGRVFRVAPDGTVRWRYISADDQQRRYQLRWSRYVDPISDQTGITAAENARCS